jgi:hypothetical protein
MEFALLCQIPFIVTLRSKFDTKLFIAVILSFTYPYIKNTLGGSQLKLSSYLV